MSSEFFILDLDLDLFLFFDLFGEVGSPSLLCLYLNQKFHFMSNP